MLDIKWIRENQEAFVKGLTNRGYDKPGEMLNRILKLDEQRRATIQELQEAQARRNATSKKIGEATAAKDEKRAKALKEEVARFKTQIQEGEEQERRLDAKLKYELERVPNTPAPDVPVCTDADSNVVLREVGKPTELGFAPKQHFEIGEALGLMDFETAAKLSGARFVVLKGALARLERALSAFMLDLHTTAHGYTEVNPPLLVRDDTMFGTAQLPKFRDDQFRTVSREIIGPDEFDLNFEEGTHKVIATFKGPRAEQLSNAFFAGGRDETTFHLAEKLTPSPDLLTVIKKAVRPIVEVTSWLIPTAEVPLTNLVRDAITDEAKLPLRVTAGTPCFRAEAGAAGKDTRGMIRQHQFDKVELVSITTPEQSADEHERMTDCAETVLQQLELPYRVVVLSTGDMGFAAQKTYDIEVWLPGQGTYREISSCSNCGDFQARRMNARYRPKDSKQPRLVHTLNGSGVAVGRALIAVLENYQEADGGVRVPNALRPYMSGLTKIEAAKP